MAPPLSKLACSPHDLLQILILSKTPASGAPEHSLAKSSRGRSAAAASRDSLQPSQTSDIGGFCGVSDVRRAALTIISAAIASGDCSWDLLEALSTLDAFVKGVGPAVKAQPLLLVQLAGLYAAVEVLVGAQGTLDIQGGTAGLLGPQSHIMADGCRPDLDQRDQYHSSNSRSWGGAGMVQCKPSAAQAVAAGPQHLLAALTKVPSLPWPSPGSLTAHWMLSKAVVAPGIAMRLLGAWLEQCMLPEDGRNSSGGSSRASNEPTSSQGYNTSSHGGLQQDLQAEALEEQLLGCKAGLISVAAAVAQQVEAASLLLNAVVGSGKQKQQQGGLLSLLAQLLKRCPELVVPLLLDHQLLEVTRRVLLDSLGGLSSSSSRGGFGAPGDVGGGGMGAYLVLLCCEVLLAAVGAAVALEAGPHSSLLLQQASHQV